MGKAGDREQRVVKKKAGQISGMVRVVHNWARTFCPRGGGSGAGRND